MGLLRKQPPGKPQNQPNSPTTEVRAVMARSAYCRVCKDYRNFSRCWLRTGMVPKCTCCGIEFENPAALYRKFQPACPRCGEFLEQPGFEYGLCDGCGSKYELIQGTVPSLLPNKKQRDTMNQVGKSWSKD